MRCKIEEGILVVDAESLSETKKLEKWRADWHIEPKQEKWFQCNYYNPIQVVDI